jgi:hypothetical protein
MPIPTDTPLRDQSENIVQPDSNVQSGRIQDLPKPKQETDEQKIIDKKKKEEDEKKKEEDKKNNNVNKQKKTEENKDRSNNTMQAPPPSQMDDPTGLFGASQALSGLFAKGCEVTGKGLGLAGKGIENIEKGMQYDPIKLNAKKEQSFNEFIPKFEDYKHDSNMREAQNLNEWDGERKDLIDRTNERRSKDIDSMFKNIDDLNKYAKKALKEGDVETAQDIAKRLEPFEKDPVAKDMKNKDGQSLKGKLGKMIKEMLEHVKNLINRINPFSQNSSGSSPGM